MGWDTSNKNMVVLLVADHLGFRFSMLKHIFHHKTMIYMRPFFCFIDGNAMCVCVCVCLSVCVCVLNVLSSLTTVAQESLDPSRFRVREQGVENMTSMWLHHSMTTPQSPLLSNLQVVNCHSDKLKLKGLDTPKLLTKTCILVRRQNWLLVSFWIVSGLMPSSICHSTQAKWQLDDTASLAQLAPLFTSWWFTFHGSFRSLHRFMQAIRVLEPLSAAVCARSCFAYWS